MDFIFQFLFDNKSFPHKKDSIRYYFDDGARSARQLSDLIASVCKIADRDYSVLEFASGYGCVTRHLVNVLDRAAITSCDIHASAVEFIRETIGVNSVLSATDPEELDIPHDNDVVFALSFFSHMPKRTWRRWLDSLLSRVAPGGYLIFTTHGVLSLKYLGNPELDASGFWFAALSEQKDLSTEDYGQAVVHPRYTVDQILQDDGRELVFFHEGAWWEHQDLYIVRRTD